VLFIDGDWGGAGRYYLRSAVCTPSHGDHGDLEMVTAGQKKKVEKVMHEHKHGTLKSGSGKKVKSRKQAIAIAMSESGQSRKRRTSSRKMAHKKAD
jgi:hypothetical protein